MADEAGEQSRDDKIAALKAKAEAMKAARAAAQTGGAGGTTQAAAKLAAKPAAPSNALEVPVSSLNPGGRPGTPPKAPAVTARSHRNSSRIGGNSSEKAVRVLTPMPIVTNTIATISQP